MIHFVTALPVEASPFIRHYSLKQRSVHGLRVFENENIRLIISGTGKITSAIAATILMSQRKDHDQSLLVQIGFAGSADISQPPGSLWMINSITDYSTGRTVYPDMIWKHPFRESALTTVDRVLTEKDKGHFSIGLYDMEAFGFYQAGIRFLNAHQIVIFKIVSDYLGFTASQKNDLPAMMENFIPSVTGFIEQVHGNLLFEKPAVSPDRDEKVRMIKEKLNLTETQYHQLRYAVKAYGIRHGNDFIFSEPITADQPKNAVIRDRFFQELLDAVNQ